MSSRSTNTSSDLQSSAPFLSAWSRNTLHTRTAPCTQSAVLLACLPNNPSQALSSPPRQKSTHILSQGPGAQMLENLCPPQSEAQSCSLKQFPLKYSFRTSIPPVRLKCCCYCTDTDTVINSMLQHCTIYKVCVRTSAVSKLQITVLGWRPKCCDERCKLNNQVIERWDLSLEVLNSQHFFR